MNGNARPKPGVDAKLLRYYAARIPAAQLEWRANQLAAADYIEQLERELAAQEVQMNAVRYRAERAEAAHSAIPASDALHFKAYFDDHGIPSKLAPSCLVCGQAQPDRSQWAIQHVALPNMIVCQKCRDAAQSARSAISPSESVERDAARYRWLAKMWPREITRLVHNHHWHGPTSSEIGAAIDAAMRSSAGEGKE